MRSGAMPTKPGVLGETMDDQDIADALRGARS
jgi:hypothetical protein